MTAVAEEFEAQRPLLFGLAYRLLGSAAEAEDVADGTITFEQYLTEQLTAGVVAYGDALHDYLRLRRRKEHRLRLPMFRCGWASGFSRSSNLPLEWLRR
jgi:hypothetical protein